MVEREHEQVGSDCGPAYGRGALEGSWWAYVGNGETHVLEVQVSGYGVEQSSCCLTGCHHCLCTFYTLMQVLRPEGPAGPSINKLQSIHCNNYMKFKKHE